MHVLVPVKRVVDYNVRVRVRSDGSGVDTTGLKMSLNPFDEVASSDEFYVNEQLRYTRAQLLDACKRGGFVAVVGESGSGKTTLRRDLQERVQREDLPIQIIRPYVVGMEPDDVKGKTLKASAILDAIMATIAPHEPLRSSSDARYRQLENRLKESHRAGTRHAVLIEEAHAMPKATLRHLKRFVELEDGFSRLLSVILLGQNELAEKLDPRDPSVREVVQRCEIITLPPLGWWLKTSGSAGPCRVPASSMCTGDWRWPVAQAPNSGFISAQCSGPCGPA